jgi:hypothetical protein
MPNMNARPITPPPQLELLSTEGQPWKSLPLPAQLARACQYSFPIKDVDIRIDSEPINIGLAAPNEEFRTLSRIDPMFIHCQAYMTVDSLEYFGVRYRVGQVVAVKGKDMCIYYVEIRELYLNEYGQKFFSFTWLLPLCAESSDRSALSQESVPKASPSKEQNPSPRHHDLSPDKFKRTSLHKAVESFDCVIGLIFE